MIYIIHYLRAKGTFGAQLGAFAKGTFGAQLGAFAKGTFGAQLGAFAKGTFGAQLTTSMCCKTFALLMEEQALVS